MKSEQRRRFLKTAATSGAGLAAGLAYAASDTAPLAPLDGSVRFLYPARTAQAQRAGSLPPLGFRVFHKLGFGPRPANPANPGSLGDLDYFNSLGGNDSQRFAAWLDEQIFGGADPEVDSRTFQNPNFVTLAKSLTQLWTEHRRFEGPSAYQVARRPYVETQFSNR